MTVRQSAKRLLRLIRRLSRFFGQAAASLPPFSPPTRQRVGSILWLTTPYSCRLALPCSPDRSHLRRQGAAGGRRQRLALRPARGDQEHLVSFVCLHPYSFYRRALSGCPAAVATCASTPRSGRFGCARTDRAPASQCSNNHADLSVKYRKIAQFSGQPQQEQSAHRCACWQWLIIALNHAASHYTNRPAALFRRTICRHRH